MKTKIRFHKLTALLLTLTMLITFIPGFTLSASADEIENIYEQMLRHITPENSYGLGDIPESRIFHAWGWSYQNIKAKLEDIAEQGFSTILVSPPNEIKMSTKDANFQEGWQMLYQPAGFQLNESWDNALGTKSEFIELCETAHALGFKIMVETVVGYMGTDDDYVGEYDNVSEDPMDHLNPRAAEFEPELLAARAFHSPWVNSEFKSYEGGFNDYEIEESLTQHVVNGKPDLATETQLVQDAIYDYFVELVEAGADGFYFNDAKYIETPSDANFASDFWEDTFVKIRENYPDKNLQAIAEMIDGPGDGRSTAGYLQSGMNLTNTAMSDAIRDSVINGTDITAAFDDEFPQENSVLWGESYKSYANGETSSLTSEQRAKIWALTVSRKEAKGIYLGRPSDELAEGKNEVNTILSNITLGEANITDWSTEAVKRVNHFASFFENADENVHYDNGFVIIERDGAGAVLVNMNGKEANVSLNENTLADGEYTDANTGNKFTVGNGKISGEIGESGIAVLYRVEIYYNIWVGGERFTSEKLTIVDANGGKATYEPTTNTLTLDNYTYSGDGYEKKAILYSGAQGDTLNINLVGESCVTLTNDIGQGLDAWGSITFSGSGSLDITGGPHGVNVMGALTVNGCSITATGDSYGVNVMDDLTINSGSLTATGGSLGVHTMSSIALLSGSLSATGGSYGMNAMGDVTVLSGSLSAIGDNYGVNAMGSITLSDGTIVAQGETYAINNTPTVDSDFTDATVWYGASASEANEKGGKLYKDLLDISDTSMEIIAAKYVRIAGNTYTITFNPNGGSVEPATMTALGGKLESLPAPTRSGYNFNGWFDAETGGNKITTDTVFTEETTVYAQWTKRSSSGGGSSSNTTTTTTKNEDGSTTKTTKNKSTGTVTEVTTNTDGSTTTVETKKDGTVTTTEKDRDGNTTTTVEKPDGTSTTTEKNKDGSEKVTEEKADGSTVTTEKDTDGTKTVTTENADGSTTTEETKKDGTKVITETNADGETKTEIDLPKDKETEVTIPVPDAEDVTSITVTDKDGKETEITDFEVTDDGVKISVSGDCTVVINKAARKEFEDVHPVNHWATADVDYAYIKGLMMGTNEKHFSPDVPLTRAMLVTVLYRLEGEPEMKNAQWFEDVAKGQWYSDAVAWATFNGITMGYGDGNFGPDDNITREQIAAIMHRYAQYKGYDVTQGGMLVREYDDYEAISDYALSAMTWTVNTELLKGKGNNNLAPQDNATRAEIAAILHRFIESNK